MMYKHLFFAIASSFFVSFAFSMNFVELPIEIYREGVVPSVDLFTANALFSTCKPLYTMYGTKEDPVQSFLVRNPEECSLLPENTYHAALIHFSQQGNRKMVKLLITQENDTQRKGRAEVCLFTGRTPPIAAISDVVEMLCNYTMLAYRGDFKRTAVYVNRAESRIARAMNENKRQVLKVCIKNRVKLNTLFPTSSNGKMTYFCWAAANNDIEIMKLLKKVGANVNIKGKKGNTLLHLVVKDTNNFELVKILIDCGADVNQKSNLNCIPFDYARSDEIRKLLIEHGADVPWYERIVYWFA